MKDPNNRSRKIAGAFFGLLSLLLVIGTWSQVQSGALRAALIQFVLALALAGLCIYLVTRPSEIDDPELFRAELRRRRPEVEQGTFLYKGHRIGPDTVFVQFMSAISLGFVSSCNISRYYVRGRENTFFISTLSTLLSLIAGWWGIPSGPKFTVQAVTTNMSGGIKSNVRDILAGL